MKDLLKSLLQPDRLAILGAIWLGILLLAVPILLKWVGLTKENFRRQRVPVGLGLIIILWALPALVGAAFWMPKRLEECAALGVCLIGFGLLGLLDDWKGDRSASGLRGHFRAFFIEGVVTTGFVKAAGGAMLAVAVPHWVMGQTWGDSIQSGMLIALCANALNLFDLRPGRCLAIYFLAALSISARAFTTQRWPIPLDFVTLPALAVWERDARGLAQLGDTGSNALGACLGLTLVIHAPRAIWPTIFGLVALHLIAEKWSLTKIVEKNPVLHFLDRLTGVR